MSSRTVERVVVVVPAHDEEVLIGGALEALRVAADAVAPDVATTLVVVANGCSDGTVAGARAAGAEVLVLPTANVGAARAAGMAWALDAHAGRLDGLWLATTDADSRVAPGWLSGQVDAARAGADLYLGTVTLALTDRLRFATWSAGYDASFVEPGRHGHVHGASMGMRATTYAGSGGFRPLPVGEDADLVSRIASTDACVVWDESCPVVTSARLVARAPAGVSRDLELSLEACDEAV